MMKRAARLATRHPRLILIAAVLLTAIALPFGGGVAELLTSKGFENPASESQRAEDALAQRFGAGPPNVVLLVTARRGSVDDSAPTAAGTALTEELAAEDGVDDVLSYWSAGDAPQLRDRGGTRALVLGRIEGDDDQVGERVAELAPRYQREAVKGAVDVRVGGSAMVSHEVDVTIEDDLVRAELIAFPITLVLLILAFGSVVAGLLPLLIGAMSLVGTLLVLRLLVSVTEVSVYALNLTIALGLGLAIDYSLFVVSRHREELRAGYDPRTAAARAVRTAGRTVAFSALTVAAALLTLLVFPFTFLRSMAWAGVGVTLLAGLFSVLVLPALLVLLGRRVNMLTLWARSVTPPEKGLWYRIAALVMRRPLRVATPVVALLLLLGAPFLGINLTSLDDRVLPESAESRQIHDVLRQEFSEETGELSVLAPAAGRGDADFRADVGAYAARLAALPGVARVDAATGTYCGSASKARCEPGRLTRAPDSSPRYAGFRADGATYLSVIPSAEPASAAGRELVRDVRAAPAPWPVMVTGESAVLVDSNHSLLTRLPWALAAVGVITAVLLFLMFGSLVVPLTAIVLDVLSLTATFGAMVWVFQDGHLSGLLGFTPTGGLNAAMPVLMFCVAFGLSMDYEVMLLSRIKEEYDAGAGNRKSVTAGLQSTGRILTAAAVIIAVVMIAFATSEVSFIKLFGVGLALAVAVDAFLIRGILVPAVMRWAGDGNWWAPAPLRRFHARWGISERGEANGPLRPAAQEVSRPAEERVRAGASGYSRAVLAAYDLFVLGVVCRLVWHCPRGRILQQYDRNVGARHLDLGPGSGYFLDRCAYPVPRPKLTLLDLDENVLARNDLRLARYAPRLLRRNVLEPLDLGEARFDSAGLNFLLHRVPGGMAHKASIVDHVAEYLPDGGRIFGATVLASGVEHGRLAPRALKLLNADRKMSNAGDSLDKLVAELSSRFADFRVTVQGSVALFEATVRHAPRALPSHVDVGREKADDSGAVDG